MSQHYTAEDTAAVDRIKTWLARPGRGHKPTTLARAAGISSGLLSSVLGGKYKHNPTEHLAALEDAIARADKRRAEPAEIPFCQTSVADQVHAVISRAQQDRDFGVFFGRVGTGKTVAIKAHQAANPSGTVVVEAYPGADASVILRILCRMLSSSPVRRTKADMTGALVDALKGTDKVLVIDEAESLNPQALLHLRRISDSAGVGVVLIGTPLLMSQLYDPDGVFGQITSRVGLWPEPVEAITETDALMLCEAYLDGPLETDTAQAFVDACQGSARLLRNLLRNSARKVRAKGGEITPAIVDEVERHTQGGRRLAA